MTITTVGIVGGGALGGAFARALARAGVSSVISKDGWRGDSLAPLVNDLAGMVSMANLEEVVAEDVVFVSVCWAELADTLSVTADWEGRILIDATNPVLPGSGIAEIGDVTSSEIVRDLSPGAQLVKAFNTLQPELLAAEPQQAAGRRVVFLAGDHLRAKIEISRLIAQMGFAGIDVGGLVSGGKLLQCPNGPLCGHNLLSSEL
jgi:8-hydroxy-5-deazaflavin:NADPH oxidoreductase